MAGPSESMLQASGVAQDIKALDAAAQAALKPVLAQAQAELAAKLQAWVTKLGPNAATEKYSAAKVQQLYLSLGIASSQLAMPKGNFPTVVADAVKKVLGQSQTPTQAIATLDAHFAGLKAKFADLGVPDLTRSAWFAKGDKLLLDQYATSAARYAGQVKHDLKLQLGVGVATGETVNELTKRLANLSSFKTAVDASAGPKKAGAAMAAGLTKRYEHWAERLVRTEIANAYNYAAVEGIKHVHSIDDRVEMRWDASLDKRVCPFCAKLHDVRAKVNETFPGGFARPPAHPNCRCAVVAWIDEDWAATAGPAPVITMTAEQAAKKDAAKKAAETKAATAAKKKAEQEALAKKLAEEAAAKKKAEDEAKAKAAAEAAAKAAVEAAAKKAAEEAAALQAKMSSNILAPTPYASYVPAYLVTPTGAVPPLSKDSPKHVGVGGNYGLKAKGADWLKEFGLVQLDKDTWAGHGHVWKWESPTQHAKNKGTKEWVQKTSPWSQGYTYDHNTKTWGKKEAVPQPAPTPPPAPKPVAPPPVVQAPPPNIPKPADIKGYEWKASSSGSGWLLYKDGVPAWTKVPAYNATTAPKLETSYNHPKTLLDAGMITTGHGEIQGHGYVFKLDGVTWNMTAKAGKPVASPTASTTPKPATTPVAATPSRPMAPPAPATWTPNAIELAANRKGVVDFNAHTSTHFAGLHGAAFTTDGDAVEGGSVRVVKVKGSDGKDYYEAVFKLTHPYGDRARMMGTGEGDWTFKQRAVKSGVLVDSGEEHRERIKTKITTAPGYRMEIGETGAVRNAVRIRATSLSELNGAMDSLGKHLGVDTRKVPDKEDLVLQAKARMAAKANPEEYGRLMKNATTPDAQKRAIEQVWASTEAKHPWMGAALKDAKEIEVYPGHKTLYSETMGKHFEKEFGHMVHAGSPPAKIAASIISDTGLMSSNKRFNSGIFTTGMSTSTDFATGGADGVFMRLQSKPSITGSGGGSGFRVEIDTAKVMGRMDWWAFNHDNYGRAGYDEYSSRWAVGAMKKGSETGGNEVMAPDGVPPSAIRRMVCGSASYRDQVLAELRASGVTKINGKKIEDVVVYLGR